MLKFNSYVPRIFLKINGTRYGRKLKLIGWPFIFRYPKAQVRIGDNVSVNSNFFSNLIGLYQRTIIIARGEGRIEIGDRVGISGATIYAREHITIGDDSLIGANTKIFDNDFHPTDASERLEGRLDTLVTKEVVIGKNVFVGCNCIIL
jgi:acetyltransferase-like isoleucine patch superfamily enzyme